MGSNLTVLVFQDMRRSTVAWISSILPFGGSRELSPPSNPSSRSVDVTPLSSPHARRDEPADRVEVARCPEFDFVELGGSKGVLARRVGLESIMRQGRICGSVW